MPFIAAGLAAYISSAHATASLNNAHMACNARGYLILALAMGVLVVYCQIFQAHLSSTSSYVGRPVV